MLILSELICAHLCLPVLLYIYPTSFFSSTNIFHPIITAPLQLRNEKLMQEKSDLLDKQSNLLSSSSQHASKTSELQAEVGCHDIIYIYLCVDM
jgi:hypothetical protein